MKMTKNSKKVNADLDRMKEYSLEDAVKMVKKLKFTKFDESVDLAMNLGVDPVMQTKIFAYLHHCLTGQVKM